MTTSSDENQKATPSAGVGSAGTRAAIPGSARQPAADAAPLAHPQGSGAQITATVVLRRRAPLPDSVLAAPIDRETLEREYGADPADVELVTRTLAAAGVQIEQVDAASRRLRVSGTVDALQTLFGTSLEWAESTAPSGERVAHWHRSGELSVPGELGGIVTAVLGLDGRPQARANFRVSASAAKATSYTPPQLAKVYGFPENTDGSGRTVAIVELGGGFAQSDLDAYFAEVGTASPTVTAVGVDGGSNVPGGDPNGADGEVLLDIEVVGALAPATEILVYFSPNTDDGFVDAVSQAAHATPTPDAISISWGQAEDQWTAQARQAMDDAFTDAAALGVTITVAAGDDGSTDRETDGKAHVDFPASSPHALACGGTSLVADATSGAVTSETVWNDGSGGGATGGGVSTAFPLPSWQASAGVASASGVASPGRGVPDVSAVADPETGYKVRVDGQDTVIGGTSAVAPLWAALVARLVQATGKPLGLLQPKLYGAVTAGVAAAGFRDITSGDNGAYSAGAGWDACTGLGVPDGTALLAVLQG